MSLNYPGETKVITNSTCKRRQEGQSQNRRCDNRRQDKREKEREREIEKE